MSGRERVGESASEVSDVIESLEHKLSHVLEPAMRRALLREHLITGSPETAHELLHGVLRRSRGDSSHDLLLHTLEDLLLAPPQEREPALGYQFRRRLYEVAAQRGDETLMRLLRSTPAVEELEQPDLRMPKELADIPLGRRRSLAKGEQKHWLELLAMDSDPIVIRNLLRNPKLVEADVVHIAALRPVAVGSLLEVARSERWMARSRVRVALARNPYTPAYLAIKLVSSLPLPDLKAMRSDPDLHAETQRQIEAELARRAA